MEEQIYIIVNDHYSRYPDEVSIEMLEEMIKDAGWGQKISTSLNKRITYALLNEKADHGYG